MTRTSIVVIISFVLNNLSCQTSKLDFKDYNQILSDLKNNGQESEYFNDLDYESMIYLDKTCIKTLLKVNNAFLMDYSIDTTILFLDIMDKQHIKYYKTSIKDIKDFFIRKSEFESISRDLLSQDYNQVHELDPSIYFKDTTKAVYTIFGNSWSKTYRITLTNATLKIESLYEIIE